ncbi:hypothetical protein PR002_g20293 [Phytophthora rubi]|uniref:Uncharacterized protein n=1 Tax=Phytophthora rubi TaxID=129364 RepID=A0A6A3JHT6_9STRA|nr:hypothetical protein PR002_g20293 [Phytophthora rubi]
MPTIAQLRTKIDRLNQAMAGRTRVPSNLPKFTGKRGEDVREFLFQIENACRINGILIEDTSTRLPGITGSAMEKTASGWFLHWSSTTRNEEHTWGFSASMCSNISRRRTTKPSCAISSSDSSKRPTSRPRTASILPSSPCGRHEHTRPSTVLREWPQASHTQLREAREPGNAEWRNGLSRQV